MYVKDPTRIQSLYPITPSFGDHFSVVIELKIKHEKAAICRHNWKHYTPVKLNALLHDVDWQIEPDVVQAYWNNLESKIIEIVDQIAPLELQQTNRH